MNKKAVSLMISYVVLIAIAIALSIGIYSWLKIIASDVKPKVNCEEGTVLTLTDYKIIYRNLTIDVKNSGRFNIDGFIMTVSNDSDKPPTMNLLGKEVYKGYYYFMNPLKPGEKKSMNFSNQTTKGYQIELDEVKKIQIQPFIEYERSIILCEDSVIEQDVEFEPSPFYIQNMKGLVSWWKFENNFEDSIGNNDAGSVNGNPIFVSGVEGSAVEFDGADDYIQLDNPFSLNKSGSAVSIWIKPKSINISNYDNHSHFLGSGSATVNYIGLKNSSSHAFLISESTENGDYWMYHNYGDYSTIKGNWMHMVLTVESDAVSLYVDGSVVDTRTVVNNLTLSYFGQGNLETRYNGTMDEVLIFNRSLVSEEIENIYDEQKS
ncbi:hypothetical protein GF386_05160 [Candidatus Pacearchaeota archaeon]|nr:hypothetical protein [Candidatus Pacearchaeota archaeon]MBD3283500.1 hypothetical protein [Candidatus Pacearchaeota archaeon]